MDQLHRAQAFKVFKSDTGKDRHVAKLIGQAGCLDLLDSHTLLLDICHGFFVKP